MMSKFNGLSVLDADDQLSVSVTPADLKAGNVQDPEQHPVAIALRRKRVGPPPNVQYVCVEASTEAPAVAVPRTSTPKRGHHTRR